jgi:translation initiation factor 2A
MLILISHDMDKNNYYGKKTLQYYNIQTKFANSVTESFVHDAQWHPNGKEFVLIHGEMPNPKVIPLYLFTSFTQLLKLDI